MLTSQDMHSISFASPASECNRGACCGPIIDAFQTWITLDDLGVVITTMLRALQAAMQTLSCCMVYAISFPLCKQSNARF